MFLLITALFLCHLLIVADAQANIAAFSRWNRITKPGEDGGFPSSSPLSLLQSSDDIKETGNTRDGGSASSPHATGQSVADVKETGSTRDGGSSSSPHATGQSVADVKEASSLSQRASTQAALHASHEDPRNKLSALLVKLFKQPSKGQKSGPHQLPLNFREHRRFIREHDGSAQLQQKQQQQQQQQQQQIKQQEDQAKQQHMEQQQQQAQAEGQQRQQAPQSGEDVNVSLGNIKVSRGDRVVICYQGKWFRGVLERVDVLEKLANVKCDSDSPGVITIVPLGNVWPAASAPEDAEERQQKTTRPHDTSQRQVLRHVRAKTVG